MQYLCINIDNYTSPVIQANDKCKRRYQLGYSSNARNFKISRSKSNLFQ